MSAEPNYLYLTTIGRKTGNPHKIEIWFVGHAGNFYIVSGAEKGEADWVKNIRNNPSITVSVGSQQAPSWNGVGRIIDRAAEPDLAREVSRLMDTKYGWSNGLIVELAPNTAG